MTAESFMSQHFELLTYIKYFTPFLVTIMM